ncbi:aminotransferase class V-fold PLP-dependent enzyme [Actinosynnema sp. CS-041913]|uniref:aminotransferase class V-fold PLP-dependent enzyme n=1 Tax=Actinosynnema sp. CS-041913 TaxID=3239917 RepID=UPI003D90123A
MSQSMDLGPPGGGIRRRQLLLATGLTGVALGVGAAPLAAEPGDGVRAGDPETWRRMFVLDRDPLFLNVGTVGSPPREVLRTESRQAEAVARQALSNYHGTFDAERAQIAASLGCDADELFLSDNTTHGVGTVLAGLDLTADDEILTTNHEHPAVNTPLAVLRHRRGVTVRRVALPVGNRQRAEDYRTLFEAAITARTKLLVFSAPVFRTGTMLPVRLIAELAQRHGITTLLDGAHIPGMFAYRYRELGVDFLAGSGAKWQCGPARTGVLYLRNKVIEAYNPNPLPTFWPTVTSTLAYPDTGLPPRTATGSYDVAALLQDAGNPSLAQVAGFVKACEIWDRLGRAVIERYVLGLSARLKEKIAERWGTDALYSPKDDPRLASAITSFNPFARPSDVLDLNKANAFVTRMRDEHHITIRTTVVPIAGTTAPSNAIRVSTHLFHGEHDVDRFVDAAWRLSRAMG